MTRKKTLFANVQQEAIVAVVREETADAAYEVARAYARGGMKNIEITLTTPDALSIISVLASE